MHTKFILDIVVGFEEQSFELSENSGSSTGSVCIAVMDGNIDEQMPSFEMQNVAGFAEGKNLRDTLT